MKRRIEALTRIGKLQARLHDLKRSRLAAIEQEQAASSDDLRAVFAALESSDLAYGPQAAFSARRARAIEKRLDALAREREEARREAEAHGVRAKLAEQAAEAAERRYRDTKARKELAEIIERALARHAASQG